MSNEEQVKQFRDSSINEWNKWRKENPVIRGIDLQEADFSSSFLKGIDLSWADLRRTNLSGDTLCYADLNSANLLGADLRRADLREANLKHADLRGANLTGTRLYEADFTASWLDDTVLVNLDLSETKGLDEVIHKGPSPISTSTLERSKGKIPEVFLRGCGLSDWEIESAKLYRPDLSVDEVNDIVKHIFDLRSHQTI